MFKRLSIGLLGVFMGLLLAANTLFWVMPLYVAVLIKLLTPVGSRPRDRLSQAAAACARNWAACNTWLVDKLLPTRWDISIDANVKRDGQYLVCSNHQSWNDIVVLMKAFGRDTPFFKFFIKQELIWVPFLGLAWWGLDYPFMKRYKPSQIKRNPKLKGADLETTRRACERFRNQPCLVLNFLEGTRFTQVKHDAQNSPYRYLLRPKSGGFAFALSALGAGLHSMLDVTIVYPDGAGGLWQLLSGQIPRVIVSVRQLEVPPEFFTSDYGSDSDFRKRFQRWLGQIWSEKDARIDELRKRAGVATART